MIFLLKQKPKPTRVFWSIRVGPRVWVRVRNPNNRLSTETSKLMIMTDGDAVKKFCMKINQEEDKF